MASPSFRRFARLPPWQKLSALTVLVTLCAMACSSEISAFIAGKGSAPCPNIEVAASSNKIKSQSRLVQALKQEGGYSAAATFLGAVDLDHLLPESSTILAPMDEGLAASGLQFSTFNTAMPILQYHVIPQRLVFHDLQQLPVGQTLQTLLPDNTIIITSNSSANFTIDDVPISRRNLFVSSSTVVHGISSVLNFDLYGKMTHLHGFTQPQVPPAKSPASGGPLPAQQIMPPPSSAGDGFDNLTVSPAFPPVSSNFSFPAPSTSVKPDSQARNGTQEASTPLPVPTTESSQSHLTPPPASVSQVPSNPVQKASPLLQTNCTGRDVARGLVCVPSGSSHQVRTLKFYRLTFLVFPLSGIHLVEGRNAVLRLLLLYFILAMMAGISAMADKEDVSEVLRSKGGFDYAATYLEAIDMHRVLPNRSTVLVPTDAAIEATGLIYNTLGEALPTLQYHVITKELSFKDLQMLPVGEMLETMLPKSLLMVTSNAPQNFTLNDVLLSHPDIACINGSAVHGINGVMNYSRVLNSPLTGTTGQLLAPPLPPELNMLPLPESAAPFAVPFPVSSSNVLVKESISWRSTLYSGILLSGILVRIF